MLLHFQWHSFVVLTAATIQLPLLLLLVVPNAAAAQRAHVA